MLQGARRCWLHLSCPYTGCLNDSMAMVDMLLTCGIRLPQLSSELEFFSVRKQGANHSHQNFCVQSCSWPSSSLVGKSHHALSCQPWLHQLKCTYLTATRWQSLKSCLCCTRQPEENDEPAAGDLDCHKSHRSILAQSCCQCWSKRHSVQQWQPSQLADTSSTTLMWPSINGTPITEFTTEGYSLPHWCSSSWQWSIKLCPDISLAASAHNLPVTMDI